jgi:FG-GAP repeat
MRTSHVVLISVLFSTSTVCFGAGPKQLAELTASDGTASDNFGAAVAVSGKVVVVGALDATVGGNPDEGAAYVFVKHGDGWSNMTQVAKLTPSVGFPYQYFGESVAMSGNTIVVGPYIFEKPEGGWKDMNETVALNRCEGAVAIAGNTLVCGTDVFLRPKGGWVADQEPVATLSEADPLKGDDFGGPVAISGNTIVVGADAVGIAGIGAAYVFVKPAGGWTNMTETAKLTASDGAGGDWFASSLAINGSFVVVGAPYHESEGAAYVFVEPSGGWTDMTQTAELTIPYEAGYGFVGVSVAINGSEALVGRPWGNDNLGGVYLYKKPKSGWVSTSGFNTQLVPTDGFSGDAFGIAVAVNAGTIVVGATKLPASPGAAYVF